MQYRRYYAALYPMQCTHMGFACPGAAAEPTALAVCVSVCVPVHVRVRLHVRVLVAPHLGGAVDKACSCVAPLSGWELCE